MKNVIDKPILILIEVIYIKYKTVFIICIFLAAFLCLNAVCASDNNQTDEIATIDDNIKVQVTENNSDIQATSEDAEVLQAKAAKISTTSKTSSDTVFVKNSKYDIQILDGDGNGLSGKNVTVKFNNQTTTLKTNANGHVYFKLNAVGTFKLTYSFKETGYQSLSGKKTLTVVKSSTSKISASNYVAYTGVKNRYEVTLTAGGVPIPSQKIIFTFKGKTYTKKTNSKGIAYIFINCGKGTYKISYKFNALKNVKAAKGSSKITVKKGMPTAIVNQKIYTYWEKTSTPFKIKYRDVRGDHIEGQTIIFKINKKTYKKKTDSTGLASINIKLNKGVYTLQIYSYNTAVYKKSSNTYTIVVKSKNTYKNNGFWLFGSDMKNVNLKTAAKYGVNNIFLNFYAVELYGRSAVADFATEARSLGINVHIWMQAFYNGGWISPVNKDGSYKYSLFNSIIKEAKSYASIDGIAGIHFDYLRFPGTAYKYSTGTKAINYFTQKICTELHNMNPDLILSAAVMPEPSSMKYYYGQDIPTISKYLDVLVPMVYKGNYHQGSSWIKSITSTFVSQSNGADVWTGLQGYVSDSNVQRLSASNLKKDAVYANEGGAMGVIVFRYSLFNYFDFDSI